MAEINVRENLKRDAIWAVALIVLAYSVSLVHEHGFGYDAHAYWNALRGDLYGRAPLEKDAFLYSPVFAQVIWPLAQLPWPAFITVWVIAAGATFAYLLKPLGWRLSVPLWFVCTPEIVTGNVFWLYALVVAFGLRFPALWVFVFLTKISPAIGPIWFAARREWKNLFLTVIVTVLVVGVSVAIEPSAWGEWIEFLRTYLGSTTSQVGARSLPPIVRIPAAVLLVVWGARRNRYWTIPAAMVLATPVFGEIAFVVFAGLPRLKEREANTN